MTTSPESTVDTVRRVVDQVLNSSSHGHDLRSDEDLWKLGMTSLTCMGLMLSIEDTLEVELPEEFLKEDTFRSVDAITAAVEEARRRTHEGAGSHR